MVWLLTVCFTLLFSSQALVSVDDTFILSWRCR
ncbi:hypothetical protein PVAP13_8KG274002 [Panicum virgatum]|uniref:Uncharacterized protein n=1 Tax=Panicum virgatum TaxID=38727 RepID=A0A8T0PMP4_PANVG|nr:hypothetical protein PVAP13_8KG274002 [Panicum virgatum]